MADALAGRMANLVGIWSLSWPELCVHTFSPALHPRLLSMLHTAGSGLRSSHSRLRSGLLTAELENKLQDWDSSAASLQMCAAATTSKQYSLDFLSSFAYQQRLLRHITGCRLPG